MKMTKWFALLAVVASALVAAPPAKAEGWFSDMDNAKEVTLGQLVRDPNAYVDVPVKVRVYFNRTSSNYNPYYTRFSSNVYGNFSAWPINARLYSKRDYQRSYPFFFMKRSEKNWSKLLSLKPVTSIELTCVVRDVFRGQGWIEVKEYSTEREGLRLDDIKNTVAGDAYFLAGRYKDAVKHYKEAVHSRLPSHIEAELYRKLGDAQFKAGNFKAAVNAYEDALDEAPKSKAVKIGLAAAKDMRERERWSSEAKKRAHIKVGPAPFGMATVSNRTDVDDIIESMEDPEKVRRQVEEDNADVERRVGKRRAKVAAVKGETGDHVDTTKQAAADEDDVVVKQGKVEEVADEPVVVKKGEVVEEPKAEPKEEPKAEEKAEEPKEEPKAEEKAEEPKAEPKSEDKAPVAVPVPVPTGDTGKTDDTGTEPEKTVEAEEQDGCGEVVENAKDNKLRDGEVLVVNGVPQNVVVETADDACGCGEDADSDGDGLIMLPRLPFHGCASITIDELTRIIAEIAKA